MKSVKAVIRGFLCLFLMTGTLAVKTENINAEEGIAMYRLYNPYSGEHFYTGNADERNNLVSLGWRDEGVGWIAPLKSDCPVYRLYNSYGGEHHYTKSAEERDMLVAAGWKYESIGWYSYEGDDITESEVIPVYRQYNPNAFANNHNYTVNTEERDHLLELGWQDEDISWYGIRWELVWDGKKLTAGKGKITGPSGKETWYNLDMTYCVERMHRLGYEGDYSIREDGVKMFGDYVMVAADLKKRPLGTLIQTSLGPGIVVDTGDFVKKDSKQIDIATNWQTENS